MGTEALGWLDQHADERKRAGLRRYLRPRGPHHAVIDLASNDYLGLTRHPEVMEGAIEAVSKWGAGSTGSRLVTGTTTDHEQLETELAEFVGAEAGLVFASGYAANLGIVTALVDHTGLVVSDAAVHASLVDACRLSRARVAIARHNDVTEVEAILAQRREPRAIVITESVFSTDGALAPLDALYRTARRYGATLIVDEAHGLGVRGVGGRGLVHELGLAGRPDLVVTATLSKSLAAQGGAVLGSERVRAHLIDTARSFIFDTGLNPAAVGAALAALRLLRREPTLSTRVLARASQISKMVAAPRATSAVVPVILGSPDVALAAAARCQARGVNVGCFRPPTVPKGTSRLRLTARANLTDLDMSVIAEVLAASLPRGVVAE